jgi:hypothetical protein
MRDYSKKIRYHLRELNGLAHEREVRRYLDRLASDFDRWKAGTVDTWELTDRIHRFHNGPSRKLYSQYTTRGIEDTNVAHAIVTGIIREDEVPPEVLDAIAHALAFYRHLEASDEDDADNEDEADEPK